jgi:hypothetical protein
VSITPWLWAPAIVLSLVLLVMGFQLGAGRAGAWAALAIVGQASALALIKAGALVGYQHYRDVGEAIRERPIALSLAALVVVAAVLGLVRQRREMGAWMRARARSWQVVFAILVGCALAAAPSATGWARELLLAATLQLAALLCVLFSVAHLPGDWSARVDRVRHPGRRGPLPNELSGDSARPGRNCVPAAGAVLRRRAALDGTPTGAGGL